MNSRLFMLLLTLTLPACSGGGGSDSLTAVPIGEWPKFRSNASNTGIGQSIVGSDPLSIQWEYPPASEAPFDAPISASPAIGDDGTIYAATESGDLVALNKDGTLKWSLRANAAATVCHPTAAIRSSPAVTTVADGFDGTAANNRVLFFGSDDGRLYAVQDVGNTPTCLWAFTPPDGTRAPIVSSPLFIIDAIEQVISGVYFATTAGYVYGVNRDGTQQWQYPRSGVSPLGAVTASLALDPAGPFYFTAADGAFYMVELDGNLRLRVDSPALRPLRAPFPASVAVANNLYIGTEDGRLVSLNRDGSERWTFRMPSGEAVVASPAIGVRSVTVPTPLPDQIEGSPLRVTIYVVGSRGSVYALDETTGEPAVDFTIPSGIASVSSPALSEDGCIIYGDAAGNLNLRHLTSTATSDNTPTPTPTDQCGDVTIPLTPGFAIRSSPALDINGVIYVGGDNGRLYAIGSGQ